MDESPLSRLSAEVRNQIYECALADQKIPCAYSDSWKDYISRRSFKIAAALTQTCSQVRKESRLIFYARNSFITTEYLREAVVHPELVPRVTRSVRSMGPEALEVIKDLSVGDSKRGVDIRGLRSSGTEGKGQVEVSFSGYRVREAPWQCIMCKPVIEALRNMGLDVKESEESKEMRREEFDAYDGDPSKFEAQTTELFGE